MKISVVIPAFNSEKTILRAIDSVRCQSTPVEEIIVVDDNSTDRTVEIVGSVADKGVRIIRFDENRGPGAARNAGIEAASGDWIAFLDADDEWLSSKLRLQAEVVQQTPEIVWCCTNYFICKDDGRKPKVNITKAELAIGNRAYFEDYFQAVSQGVCDIQTSTLMIRRDVFAEAGLFDTSLMRHQDWDLWWRIAHCHRAIGYIVQPQAVYHLLFDNVVVNQRRLEAKKGVWLYQMMQRHLAAAQQAGTMETFRPLARQMIRNSLLSMLFIGFTAEARTMLERMSHLLSRCERLFFTTMLRTSGVSLPLLRAGVRLFEKAGIIRVQHKNWDYLKARRQAAQEAANHGM
jgi:hypothetical protein